MDNFHQKTTYQSGELFVLSLANISLSEGQVFRQFHLSIRQMTSWESRQAEFIPSNYCTQITLFLHVIKLNE